MKLTLVDLKNYGTKYKLAMYSLAFNFEASQEFPELVLLARAMTPIGNSMEIRFQSTTHIQYQVS